MAPSLSRRIRVLLVDDSSTVRQTLTSWLASEPEIEVVGAAIDPYVARDKILKLAPDVLLLDLGLPRMDGLTFLRRLMRHHPMPVIIVSGLAEPGSEMAIEALEAGAFDVFHKPNGIFSVEGVSRELIARIKSAARFLPSASAPVSAAPRRSFRRASSSWNPRSVIVMGASTGGTEALRAVLRDLPADLPGICIVQHIPPEFSLSFAQRLNAQCALEVREAAEGDLLTPGLALVAPGDFHLVLEPRGAGLAIRLHQGARVHYQRPAADLLFSSAAACAGSGAVGVLLTGMGCDGAAGLLKIRQAGGRTLAQDEASCVVFGMPRAAQELGAVESMLPLPEMAAAICQRAEGIRTRHESAA